MPTTPLPAARWYLPALIAGAIAIGFAPIFVRLSEVGPSATAFWRLALALPVLLVWAGGERRMRAGGDRRTQKAEDAAIIPSAVPLARDRPTSPLLLAGLFFAGDLALWHWSIHFTSVANSTLEANLASVFVVLIGWLVWRQRVSARFGWAMLVALAGTALLVGRNARFSPTTLRGDALGVVTAVFYAGYLLSVKAARGRGWATAPIMAVSGVVTAAALLPVALLSRETLLPATGRGWVTLVGLAFVSHLGGQSLIAYALAGLPAAFASVGLLVQPATAAAVAWALLGETLSVGQLTGGALVLAGIVLARRESR